MNDTPKLSFLVALKHLGLVDEFKRVCADNAREQIVRAWVNAQQELMASAFLPHSFRHVRQKLGVPATHGGKRPPPKHKFYEVRRPRASGVACDRPALCVPASRPNTNR